MQLVLSNNRVVAHGENFLPMGGVVINTETGARYENATIAECENCPSDLGKVGYEYHGGVFKPCAPYGTGNNSGYFMEVCSECAVPRSSGIKIIGGIKKENLDTDDINTAFYTVLWENTSSLTSFENQTVTLASDDYDYLLVEAYSNSTEKLTVTAILPKGGQAFIQGISGDGGNYYNNFRRVEPRTVGSTIYENQLYIGGGMQTKLTHTASTAVSTESNNNSCVPIKIYGVKL